jgi:predicted secreted hydrolase
MRLRFFLLLLFLIEIVSFYAPVLSPSEPRKVDSFLKSRDSSTSFKKADEPAVFQFPLDHGAHPDFQTEWWYYTGNLESDDGREFGYQLTFFRRRLGVTSLKRESSWATNQAYMAHFALTDVSNRSYHFFEKVERGVDGLAGANGLPYFSVWLHNWTVKQISEDEFSLSASQDGIAINFHLIDLKGPILQGNMGYSQKGREPGNASYYYSQTRLETTGAIRTGETEYAVKGFSWMDHEYSTSALGEGVIGWDWFSLQMDDGVDLMLFTLRKEDGSLDEFSSGTIIYADGSTTSLKYHDFMITPLSIWRSPETGIRYPSKWKVEIPRENLILTIEPKINNQEPSGFFTYWEGAVKTFGTREKNPVSGKGYVELTSYGSSMQGQF